MAGTNIRYTPFGKFTISTSTATTISTYNPPSQYTNFWIYSKTRVTMVHGITQYPCVQICRVMQCAFRICTIPVYFGVSTLRFLLTHWPSSQTLNSELKKTSWTDASNSSGQSVRCGNGTTFVHMWLLVTSTLFETA